MTPLGLRIALTMSAIGALGLGAIFCASDVAGLFVVIPRPAPPGMGMLLICVGLSGIVRARPR